MDAKNNVPKFNPLKLMFQSKFCRGRTLPPKPHNSTHLKILIAKNGGGGGGG